VTVRPGNIAGLFLQAEARSPHGTRATKNDHDHGL